MKITLLTTGSRGDVQPFVALGKAVQKIGAEAAVAATENFEPLIRQHGLHYRKVRGNIEEVIAGGEARKAVHADNPLKAFSSLRNPAFQETLLDMTEDLYLACADSDLIIYHPGAAVGHFAAGDMGIPAILGSPFPMMETTEYPSLLFYTTKLPRYMNRWTHRMFLTGFYMITKGVIKTLYRDRLRSRRYTFPNPFFNVHDRGPEIP